MSTTVRHAANEDPAARHLSAQLQVLAEREEQHETDSKETKEGPGRQTRPMPGAQRIGAGCMSTRALISSSSRSSAASSSAPEGAPLAAVTEMDLDC